MTDLNTFNLNLLVTFEAVMEERNVTRASARLGVSQPAVSNALRDLRRLVDDPLFVRQGRGMVPTPRAEALARSLGPALDRIRSSLIDGPFDPAASTVAIRLATPDYTELMLLPAIETRLARDAPSVTLRVQTNPSMAQPNAFEALLNGACDLYINRIIGPAPGLHRRRLFEGTYACIARVGHPRVRTKLDLEAFLAERHLLIVPDDGYLGPIDVALRKLGHQRQVSLSVPRFAAAPLIVHDTDLIATVPWRMAQRFARLVDLQVLPCPVPLDPFHIDMVWSDRTDQSPAFRWFREVVAEACVQM
ncbi:MAG: LysR family transcriptional regulator [Myxococcota bacterium]